MILKSEIKDFVKKVLIIGILLSVLINFLVTYFAGFEGKSVYGESNDTKFKRVDTSYLGTTGIAVSLNIGTQKKAATDVPINLFSEVMPISYILANKQIARDKIITDHMININEYINILKTNVNSLLDSANDRESMLESFLDQVEYRYTNATSEVSILSKQYTELDQVVKSSDTKISTLKTDLATAYKTLDYDKTEETVDNYLLEKEKNTYANTYLVFVSKFISSYNTLNNYNKIYLDTIINNKDALIKNATIVLPDSGNNLLKQMNLIKTEADYKAKK